ncbi:uncharacterized protein LOC143232869 isoform X3 [Tachypleus tridentatus]|uniref:uncharacterized protein LOC143232869 isoform X3 n=1 Tax=Tachypleus tridentatus TaxID=6853 RepID=UPI003FD5575B
MLNKAIEGPASDISSSSTDGLDSENSDSAPEQPTSQPTKDGKPTPEKLKQNRKKAMIWAQDR